MLISPGMAFAPPPTIDTADAVWCGAQNGRAVMSPPPRFVPATECMRVTSSASSNVISGSIEGRQRASIVLPEPGSPTMITLCEPAAAISNARFAARWPCTSAKSLEYSRALIRSSYVLAASGLIGLVPFKQSITSAIVSTGIMSMPLMQRASSALPRGSIRRL